MKPINWRITFRLQNWDKFVEIFLYDNTTIFIPLLTHFPFLSNNIPSLSSLDTTNQSMATRSLVPKQWDPSLECKIYSEGMTHYLLDLTLFLISRGIHRAFATEVACRQGALTHPAPSHLGLAYALLVETSHFPDRRYFQEFELWIPVPHSTSMLLLNVMNV